MAATRSSGRKGTPERLTAPQTAAHHQLCRPAHLSNGRDGEALLLIVHLDLLGRHLLAGPQVGGEVNLQPGTGGCAAGKLACSSRGGGRQLQWAKHSAAAACAWAQDCRVQQSSFSSAKRACRRNAAGAAAATAAAHLAVRALAQHVASVVPRLDAAAAPKLDVGRGARLGQLQAPLGGDGRELARAACRRLGGVPWHLGRHPGGLQAPPGDCAVLRRSLERLGGCLLASSSGGDQ